MSRTGRPPIHGGTGSPEFNAWQAMRQRCNNPKCRYYKNYGGRGIKVCKRWARFENFLADMGKRPSPGHSIERLDNEKGYSPKNCAWATKKSQARNRRSNRLLTHAGKTATLQQWAEELGTTDNVLYMRLRRGWTVGRTLTQPVTACGRST